MRISCLGKRVISSDRFASSKSWNWKAGAQVHPTSEKWLSASLGPFFVTAPSVEMLKSFVGNAPNQTFGSTVYCTFWSFSKSGPRHVSFTCPSFSSSSMTCFKYASLITQNNKDFIHNPKKAYISYIVHISINIKLRTFQVTNRFHVFRKENSFGLNNTNAGHYRKRFSQIKMPGLSTGYTVKVRHTPSR